MANCNGFLDGVTQFHIPIFLAPGKALAAERIPTAIEPDFISVIDAGCAGVS